MPGVWPLRAILLGMRAGAGLRPNGYLLVTVASWGLNFVALKEAYKEISTPALALLRLLVMWGALALVCVWRGESLRLPPRDGLKLLYVGFVSMGIYMLLFLEGMRGSAATEGAILLQLAPVFTALFAAAFRQERFSVGTLIGALVALAGTSLIVYGPAEQENKLVFNVLVMLSAVMWAYSVILIRPLLARYTPLQALTLSMPGGLPVMLAYGLLASIHQNWAAVSPYGWLMFFHVAIVSGVVAFLCFYEGVRQVGATGATLYQYLVPAVAMLFALLIQGARPTWFQAVGFLVVLVGVGAASAARARTLAHSPVKSSPHEGTAEG